MMDEVQVRELERILNSDLVGGMSYLTWVSDYVQAKLIDKMERMNKLNNEIPEPTDEIHVGIGRVLDDVYIKVQTRQQVTNSRETIIAKESITKQIAHYDFDKLTEFVDEAISFVKDSFKGGVTYGTACRINYDNRLIVEGFNYWNAYKRA